MQTETLRPNAAGDETTLTPSAGTNWSCVDEEVADDVTTYVYNANTSYKRDLYNLPAHSTGSGTINSVKIYFRIGGSDFVIYAKPSQKSGGTVNDGSEQSQAAGSGWGTKSQTYTINPVTGVAYTWDEIDALQIGVLTKGTSNLYAQMCTQVYVEVNYTPQSYYPLAQITFNPALADIVKAGDALSALMQFNTSLIDKLLAGDQAATQAVLQVIGSDTVKLSDTASYLGRLLKVIAITAEYRNVKVLTAEYRSIKANTAQYRQVEAVTAQYRVIKAISALYRLVKSFTTGG